MKTFLVVLSILILVTLSSVSQNVKPVQNQENAVLQKAIDVLKGVQQKVAPDKRLARFEVSVYKNRDLFIVKGEVDRSEAKEEIIKELVKSGYANIRDSIVVLPEASCREKPYGIVTVSVAPLRAHPTESSEMVSQVLMGSEVRILKVAHSWAYVQVAEDQYLGWIDKAQIIQINPEIYAQWQKNEFIIVTQYIDRVYQQPSEASEPVCDVTAGALLIGKSKNAEWYSVGLADGQSGFLLTKSGMEYRQWKSTRQPTPENIEKTARQFVGVPYLWGGMSPKGFDCSGFTKTVFKLNSIPMQRDADQQGTGGSEVSMANDLKNLRKGDLLFFCDKKSVEKPERITHVGIYLGNKEFIHCSGLVKYNSFNPKAANYSGNLLGRLVKAKRYLK